jgi:hypothetical protein
MYAEMGGCLRLRIMCVFVCLYVCVCMRFCAGAQLSLCLLCLFVCTSGL